MKSIINVQIFVLIFACLVSNCLYAVVITNKSGTIYPAKFSKNETVMSVKQKLAKENIWDLNQIKLLWKPKVNQKAINLQNSYTLDSYGIPEDGKLTMNLEMD